MQLDKIKKALIDVLKEIQARSGLPCPELDGSVIPPAVLEKFDSTVWPAATTLMARKLDVIIPPDVHIFGGEKGKPLLTIDQAAKLVQDKAQPKKAVKVAA